MRQFKNMHIIGIDHGYGNLKTVSGIFPASVLPFDQEPIHAQDLLVYGGKYYVIGSGHREFTPDKVSNSDHYILTLASIGQELWAHRMTHARIYIAAGLPLTWVESQRESFRAYLLQNSHVDFTWRGIAYHVEIVGASVYAQGFSADGTALGPNATERAVQAAAKAECAVVFAGLPDSWESEGYDRTGLELPPEQNTVIAAVAAVQPNTVVVLHNGSPVAMPWLKDVAAVLEMHLAGEAVGEATADLLFGEANPCGRLAETFPLRLQDTPAWLNFPGDGKTVHYREDIYVGYRWYDAREMDVLFPFGYGLSYTSFVYTGLALDKTYLAAGETLTAAVSLKNTGAVAGKEVIQLYIHAGQDIGPVCRAPRELRGFAKVELQPGEEKTVHFLLDARSFAYYEERLDGWYTPSGTYTVFVGPNSRTLPLQAKVCVCSRQNLPLTAEDTTTVEDVLVLGNRQQVKQLKNLLKKVTLGAEAGAAEDHLGSGTQQMMKSMTGGLPLHALRSFGDVSNEEIEQLLFSLQAPEEKGGRQHTEIVLPDGGAQAENHLK